MTRWHLDLCGASSWTSMQRLLNVLQKGICMVTTEKITFYVATYPWEPIAISKSTADNAGTWGSVPVCGLSCLWWTLEVLDPLITAHNSLRVSLLISPEIEIINLWLISICAYNKVWSNQKIFLLLCPRNDKQVLSFSRPIFYSSKSLFLSVRQGYYQ